MGRLLRRDLQDSGLAVELHIQEQIPVLYSALTFHDEMRGEEQSLLTVNEAMKARSFLGGDSACE